MRGVSTTLGIVMGVERDLVGTLLVLTSAIHTHPRRIRGRRRGWKWGLSEGLIDAVGSYWGPYILSRQEMLR